MIRYAIREVDGSTYAEMIRHFNGLSPACFPSLEDHHLEQGHWWIVLCGVNGEAAGFAGMVPMKPFVGVGYMKRAYVAPDHRGHGLQRRLMQAREHKAMQLGWRLLVGECDNNNIASSRNFERQGFVRCRPEQPWGPPGSVYFVKHL